MNITIEHGHDQQLNVVCVCIIIITCLCLVSVGFYKALEKHADHKGPLYKIYSYVNMLC